MMKSPKLVASVVVSTILLLHGCKANDEWQLYDAVGDKLTLTHAVCALPEIAMIKQMDPRLGKDWYGGNYVTKDGTGKGVLCWTLLDEKSHTIFLFDDQGDIGSLDAGTAL